MLNNIIKKIFLLCPIRLEFLSTFNNKILFNPAGRFVSNDNINIFLGTTNNIWTTSSNWSLNRLPNNNDRVIIRANCILNTSVTIPRLLVESTRTLSWENGFARTLVVNNNYDNQGAVNMSGGNLGHDLTLNGTNLNSIGGFTTGTNSTVTYGGVTNQNILDINYCNLGINGNGIKTISSNLTVNEITNIRTQLATNGVCYLLFIGIVRMNNFGIINAGINTIEIRNSLVNVQSTVVSITGNLFVSTNNQLIGDNTLSSFAINIIGNITIDNNITLTNNTGLSDNWLTVSGIINGSNTSSVFINNRVLVLQTNHTPMTIGQFINNGGIVYNFNGNYNIPLNTYTTLGIKGTGVKTLIQNTNVNRLLIGLISSCVLDLSSFNLLQTIDDTIIEGSGSGVNLAKLTRSGTGTTELNRLFLKNYSEINLGINNLIIKSGIVTASTLNNIICDNLTFSVNNQSISGILGINFICNVIIDSNIILTLLNGESYNNLGINGNNSNSIFDVRAVFNCQSATAPMTIGQLQCNNIENTFKYTRAGNQDVTGTTYRTLEFGISGVKKLLGNIICTNFTLSGAATINFNGFTITVSGNLIYDSTTAQSLANSTEIIHTTNLYLRQAATKTLTGNRTCSNLILDSNDLILLFAGFTLTSTTTEYISNTVQKVWGTTNQPLTNLILGGSGNKTLQGNVSVPGTYTVTGTAVKVDNGFTFGNP